MVPVPTKALPKAASQRLAQYQAEVDKHPDYRSRVEAAKSLFDRRNRPSNAAFRAVRQTLSEMCHGSRRSMYCEDAPADEVEHIRPKDLYPEVVFAWKNYLYACGPCNGPKNNQFSVISRGKIVDITRARGGSVKPPRKGRPALINPREEDPLDFFMLDLLNTFEFVIIAKPGSREYDRADQTLKVLRLNERDYLKTARRTSFETYFNLLRRYGDEVAAGNPTVADRIQRTICESNHATVWAEMKRQRHAIGALGVLFDRAPDALAWPFPGV